MPAPAIAREAGCARAAATAPFRHDLTAFRRF
jgi:hypothetical protein